MTMMTPAEAMQGVMADMYYARTTDFGETYEMVDYPRGRRSDWLAQGDLLEQGEAQLRMTPAGNALYATWLQKATTVGPDAAKQRHLVPQDQLPDGVRRRTLRKVSAVNR